MFISLHIKKNVITKGKRETDHSNQMITKTVMQCLANRTIDAQRGEGEGGGVRSKKL